MNKLVLLLAIVSSLSFASIPDIKRHSLTPLEIQEMGFARVSYPMSASENTRQYQLLIPTMYLKSFKVQSVSLEVNSEDKLLFATILEFSDSEIDGYSSSFFYIKDNTITYNIEVMYDTTEKETPYIREGHILELGDLLKLPEKKYNDLFL